MKLQKFVTSSFALLLASCTHTPKKDARLRLIELPPRPIGQTAAGQQIESGGYSGLLLLKNDDANYEFMTHTDRGPNPEPISFLGGVGENARPFALPKFAPSWIHFRVSKKTLTSELVEEIYLHKANAQAISGLPPASRANWQNEIAVDLKGNKLEADPDGVDLEGVARAPNGHYWMVEEYGPSVLEFNERGKLLRRFSPGAGLPALYSQRRINRGFEGLASQNGKIYCIFQSPLKVKGAINERISRFVEFDPSRGTVTAEYLYPLGDDASKLADIASVGDGRFLVIEQNSDKGPKSIHKVFEFDISKATNTLARTLSAEPPVETVPFQILSKDVKLIEKRLAVDLVQIGYDFAEKIEGLAILDDTHIAVLNDNDFSLEGTLDLSSGRIGLVKERSMLGIVTLDRPLSASTRESR